LILARRLLFVWFVYNSGSLGGQMGIFLGASLLTISELVEFIILAGLVLCRKIVKCRDNRKWYPWKQLYTQYRITCYTYIFICIFIIGVSC